MIDGNHKHILDTILQIMLFGRGVERISYQPPVKDTPGDRLSNGASRWKGQDTLAYQQARIPSETSIPHEPPHIDHERAQAIKKGLKRGYSHEYDPNDPYAGYGGLHYYDGELL